MKAAIAGKKVEIETAKASVEKYKSQQDNVRNNREYDFLTKEIFYSIIRDLFPNFALQLSKINTNPIKYL